MNFADFLRIVTAFADTKTDLDIARGRLLVQIRGEILEATIRQVHGELVVDDELGDGTPARRWVVTRVAKLPQLADRIVDTVPLTSPFVCPSGILEDFAERDDATDRPVEDAVAMVSSSLDWRPGGTTSILYVTSDAGEGKTTVINQLAHQRALAYKKKTTDWLLVPITLGGRTFMRFDDIVIAELVNRYRFPFFYYDGFLELVRLGVVVPAFDGFEEMFVEGSTGEALSALGTLLRSLNSSGSVLIAARKAYFEFRSLATRTQLFDAVSAQSVAFARLKLRRWSRAQFLSYANERGVENAPDLYEAVELRLGADHALLTRAVLVKRLLDVAESHESLQTLLGALGHAPADYFHEFVETILSREVEKWLDRQGEAAKPLLSIYQHEELLGLVAQEMWVSGTEVLRAEVLDVVAEIFCETHRLDATQTHQVKERLPQHSLLTSAETGRNQFAFDHVDFRRYFLGESVARTILAAEGTGVRQLLKAGSLPIDTCDAIGLHVRRAGTPIAELVGRLQEIGRSDLTSSFTRENCGALIVRLIDSEEEPLTVSNITFPVDALRGRWLAHHRFVDCYWPTTTTVDANLLEVTFERCRFDTLELSSGANIANTVLLQCDIQSVTREDGGLRTYEPVLIRQLLVQAGFVLAEDRTASEQTVAEQDEETAVVERVLRAFLRTTHVNEETLRRRLGTRANLFFNNVLPALRRGGVVEEVPYLGAGHQRRFRLAVPMASVEQALGTAGGNFAAFLLGLEGVVGE